MFHKIIRRNEGDSFKNLAGNLKSGFVSLAMTCKKKQTQQAGGGFVLAEAAARPTLMAMSVSTPA